MKAQPENQVHKFAPIFNSNSEILILGTFPSVKSREQNFYYGHPQNRFWKVLAGIFNEVIPVTIDEKKAMLLRNNIAIWDVIASCDIIGSSDSSITNVVPVDINRILSQSSIKTIYANGNKARDLYNKYILPVSGIEITGLPSTSPANARFSLDMLIDSWGKEILSKQI